MHAAHSTPRESELSLLGASIAAAPRRVKTVPAHTAGRTPPIAYGVSDDGAKYADDGGSWFCGELAGAQLSEVRWSLAWDPDDPSAIKELPFLENVRTVTEQQQAAYLRRMIEEYLACDPTVTDVLLFLLQDEANRDSKDTTGARIIGGGWQSGLLTFGPPNAARRRPAYHAVAAEAAAGRSACRTHAIAWKPRLRRK